MAISFECTGCGKEYKVKDDLAGKRIRCKGCETVVTVPSSEEEEDWLSVEVEDWTEPQPASPAPPRSSSKKKSGSKKNGSKRKRSSSSHAPRIGAIAGGVFTVLIVLAFVGRLAVNVAKLQGFQGVQGAAVNWQDYTTPDGGVTVQLPGRAKPNPQPQVVPGGTSFLAETRNDACGVSTEPIPVQAMGASADELIDALKIGLPMEGARAITEIQMAGRRAVQFDMTRNGINSQNRAVVNGNKIYTFSYAYKKSLDPEVSNKFFGSIRFNR